MKNIRNKQAQEKDEFPVGKKGFAVCSGCDAVYHKKSWHHEEKFADKIEGIRKEAGSVICPACEREKNDLCEGFVVLIDIPEEKMQEVFNLIQNVGEKAIKNDILSRITKMEERDGDIYICTTENQLAVSLGKQIQKAFKGEVDTNWSGRDGIARVTWRYPAPKHGK
ncbi:hypothetical protein HY249_01440 [Candidatus Azambacteria bacterium]|nr:hypothetical protein [Candidatus Azambacteria bacterium]